MGRNQHVVPRGNRWAVKPERTNQVTSVHRTQEAAIRAGTTAARAARSELLVHGANGQIRLRNSFGNDPYPPKG
jgi:hypothetical protein